MPRCQGKDTITNGQGNMSLLELSNPIALGTEKCNVAEAQDKNLKRALMNMVEGLKSQLNPVKKSMKTQTVEGNEWKDLNVEVESVKKTQTVGTLVIKHLGTRTGTSQAALLAEYKLWKRESQSLKAK